eukprot:467107-Pleurochrysis_carterae.AAC.1
MSRECRVCLAQGRAGIRAGRAGAGERVGDPAGERVGDPAGGRGCDERADGESERVRVGEREKVSESRPQPEPDRKLQQLSLRCPRQVTLTERVARAVCWALLEPADLVVDKHHQGRVAHP